MQSGVPTANQIVDVGVTASLTPWPLPGNWDCCSVIQSMERSCRGLREKRQEDIIIICAGGSK